jgi:serine/threonine protein phosphatase PrpC
VVGGCKGVSAVPHQTAVALDKQHKFVIVGCDGLWDVVTDREAVHAVAGNIICHYTLLFALTSLLYLLNNVDG